MILKTLITRAMPFVQAPIAAPHPDVTSLRCSAEDLARPSVFGAEILELTAHRVINYANTEADVKDLNFCNITVTYTHPGQNDTINVHVWLPLEGWNERFQGTGGSGWVTGPNMQLLPRAIQQGYAAAGTDGGHDASPNASASSWALLSPGNVNWPLLHDFAYRALDDMTIIGKAVTESFYGRPIQYSYWNGCSTGGRQGLMLAQRYPGHYNGILANAPAINWATFVVTAYWPQIVASRLSDPPLACEIKAITKAAVQACDDLDGLSDGIIGMPSICHFNPQTLIGKPFDCDGVEMILTESAVKLVRAAWLGPFGADGHTVWFGLNRDTNLVDLSAQTSHGNNRTAGAFSIAEEWIKLFVAKDPDFNAKNMTDSEFLSILDSSRQQYDSIISADSPDLRDFRNAGGKIITWHGLADRLIPPKGTANYYDRVRGLDPHVHEFYRFYEAPGVDHCKGGVGPVPKDPLGVLVKWVEESVTPETLEAVGTDGTVRELCAYPEAQSYVGGDPKLASSFECIRR